MTENGSIGVAWDDGDESPVGSIHQDDVDAAVAHTPTPWRIGTPTSPYEEYTIYGPVPGAGAGTVAPVASVDVGTTVRRPDERKANAERIVTAVNLHDELLAAAQVAYERLYIAHADALHWALERIEAFDAGPTTDDDQGMFEKFRGIVGAAQQAAMRAAKGTEPNAAADLYQALRLLIERHDEQMLTAEEWEKARTALAKGEHVPGAYKALLEAVEDHVHDYECSAVVGEPCDCGVAARFASAIAQARQAPPKLGGEV